jgi:hypothetical protein
VTGEYAFAKDFEVRLRVLIATTGLQLRDSLYTDAQGFQLLPDDALMRTPTQVLYQQPHTLDLREHEGLEFTPSFPSRELKLLTATRKASAVDGTTFKFSPLSWAFGPPGLDARNQARKLGTSL